MSRRTLSVTRSGPRRWPDHGGERAAARTGAPRAPAL